MLCHDGPSRYPGVVIDNTDAGLSTTGTWPASSSVAEYEGTNYQSHPANGEEPTAIVVDNTAGSAVGTCATSTSVGRGQATDTYERLRLPAAVFYRFILSYIAAYAGAALKEVAFTLNP